MTLTYAQWKLRPNAQRNFLFVIDAALASNPATAVTIRLCSRDTELRYLSNPYYPLVVGLPNMQKNIQEVFKGQSQLSFGNIEINRQNNQHITPDRSYFIDDLLTGVLLTRGRTYMLYYGGDELPESEYQVIQTGKIRRITDWSEMIFRMEVIDFQETLRNTYVNPNMIAAGTNVPDASVGKVIPLHVGYVKNYEPILIDKVNRIYKFADTAILPVNSLVAVKDNGVSVTPSNIDLPNGQLTLSSNPVGVLTCDIQGAKFGSPATYSDKLADISKGLLKAFAGYQDAQIDSAYITACNTDIPYSLGASFTEKTSILTAIDRLISGIPAYYAFSRTGIFRIGAFKLPSGSATITLKEDYPLKVGSIKGRADDKIIRSQTIRYDKNQTVVARVAGVISDLATREWYANEWRDETYTDSNVATKFPLAEAGQAIESCIVNRADALTVATAWLTLMGRYNMIYNCTAAPLSLDYELGAEVKLTDTKYGLSSGKYFRITGIAENYSNNSVDLTLWGGV